MQWNHRAVVSCANHPTFHGGYFNVYGHAAETADVDAVTNLCEYIYEYGRAPDSGNDNYQGTGNSFQSPQLERFIKEKRGER